MYPIIQGDSAVQSPLHELALTIEDIPFDEPIQVMFMATDKYIERRMERFPSLFSQSIEPPLSVYGAYLINKFEFPLGKDVAITAIRYDLDTSVDTRTVIAGVDDYDHNWQPSGYLGLTPIKDKGWSEHFFVLRYEDGLAYLAAKAEAEEAARVLRLGQDLDKIRLAIKTLSLAPTKAELDEAIAELRARKAAELKATLSDEELLVRGATLLFDEPGDIQASFWISGKEGAYLREPLDTYRHHFLPDPRD